MEIAKKYNLFVVEDAAQAVGSYYKGKLAGTIGDIGCYSFHETKNYTMGEGGAIIINNNNFLQRAEIIREKGTDRSQFLRGQIDKYTWQDVGSSFLPSDVLAAMLFAQIERFDEIMNKRMTAWNTYKDGLKKLENKGCITLQKDYPHNAHMFFIKTKNIDERSQLITFLKKNEISSAFHYVPLHSSPFANKILKNIPNLPVTVSESEKLLRLPLFADITHTEIKKIIDTIYKFYGENE